MSPLLSPDEQRLLLQIARAAVTAAVSRQPLPALDPDALPARLAAPGASFVTLTRHGDLRGCIGALQAYQPLCQDVQQHAAQSAVEDPRFYPVTPEEVAGLEIEISVLTAPQPLPYSGPADLLQKLRPGVDGLILQHGRRRATFLPQVWEKVPDRETFLSMLCDKMGAAPDLWRQTPLEAQVYQVEEFREHPDG